MSLNKSRASYIPTDSLCSPVISIAKSSDASSALQSALGLLGGLEKIVADATSILIKPNLCGGVPGDWGSHTHPAVIEALLERLSGLGKRVFIGEADGSFNRADEVFRTLGIDEMARRFGAHLVNLSTGPAFDITVPNPVSTKSVKVAKCVVESFLINLPVLKTHPWTRVTVNMKNLFGALYYENKFSLHARLHELIVDISQVIRPGLCIIDGTVAVKAGTFKYGVWVGSPPLREDLVIAGYDPVLLDGLSSAMLGVSPSEVHYLMLAEKVGLGSPDLGRAEIRTTNYSLPDSVPKASTLA
jgi:uncharacterized protein (DUF362 family)